MTCSTDLQQMARLPLLLIAGTLIACSAEDRVAPVAPPGALHLGIELSDTAASPGSELAVRVVHDSQPGIALEGLQGRLLFDPHQLRFLGQPAPGRTLVLLNSDRAQQGELRLVSLNSAGLDRVTADLRFAVLAPRYAARVQYRLDEAVSPELTSWHQALVSPVRQGGAIAPGDSSVGRLTLLDWVSHFGLTPKVRPAVAGAGRIYGDITGDLSVNVLDAFVVANLSVGNVPLLTNASFDNVVAGNVYPPNLPGLGEATDPIPPGRNGDGTHDLTVGDAAAIANESVLNDMPVAGEVIPGRQPRPFRAIVSGDITTDRTFSRDTVYELQGLVNVVGSTTLSIQAGTQIEGDGDTHARLVIRRGGNVNWVGTLLEPIVFTCKGAVKTPGCWGGIVVNGLSLLNTGQSGGDSLTICPERTSIGNPGRYGGCLVEDTTGVIDYVRVEYGGQAPEGGAPTPGLALLGVGTGTRAQHIQVHASLGDGLFLSGGTVNLRYLVLTANGQAGLRWDDGYGGTTVGGSVQFVVVQQSSGGGDGIRGSNSAAFPDATPRSRPQLYNVTVIGAGPAGGSGRGLLFENGSGGALRDAIVIQTPAAGLDLAGAETCNQVSAGMLELDHAIFFGNGTNFATDADCIDESSFALDPVRANRVVDPTLIAPLNTLTPDWRPSTTSPAASGAITPPSNLFFDLTAPHLGAVEIANGEGANIPWYAGWTRTWSGTP